MKSVEELAHDRDRLARYDRIKPALDAFKAYAALSGGATLPVWEEAHKKINHAMSGFVAKIIVTALETEIHKLNETEI